MLVSSFVLFALLASVFWALGNVLDKTVLTDHIEDAVTVTFLTGVFAGLFPLVLPLLGLASIPPLEVLLYSLTAGVIYIIPVYLYMKALSMEEVSRVVPVMNTTPVFVTVLGAIFISEVFTFSTYLGIFIAVAGAVLVSSQNFGKEFFDLKANKAFWTILAGTFLFAVYSVFAKWILNFTDFWNMFFWSRMGGLFPVALLLLRTSTREKISSTLGSLKESRIELLGVSELFNNLGVLSQTVAFSLGPVALAQTITSVQPLIVLVAVLGLHHLRGYSLDEELSRQTVIMKGIAGILVVVGVYLALI